MVKKVKMVFEADINEEAGELEMNLEWSASIQYAVMVMLSAATKHPQVREVITVTADLLEKEFPQSDIERRMSLLQSLNGELTQEQKTAIDNSLKETKPQGEA